jgi:EthD domain
MLADRISDEQRGGSMGEQIKVMYYAPRPAGRTRPVFRERWRQHGRLAMGMPEMWQHMARYEQWDVLVDGEYALTPEHLAVANGSDAVGGVGMIWFHDADALAAAIADPGSRVMTIDEREAFGVELGDRLVPTTENVVLDNGFGTLAMCSTVWRRPELTREEFSAQWRAMGIEFAQRTELARHLKRYVQNHAVSGAPGFDGLVQLEFDSAQDIAAFMAEPLLTEWLMPTESQFHVFERLETVIAHRQVIYDGVRGATRRRRGLRHRAKLTARRALIVRPARSPS